MNRAREMMGRNPTGIMTVPRWLVVFVVLVMCAGAIGPTLIGDLGAQQSETAQDAADQTSATPEKPPAPAAKRRRPSAANTFNRLLKNPASSPNAPPAEDGIHDPTNPGTLLLQWPAEAFQDLPKTNDGNRVDWVRALDEGLILPWVDLTDPEAEPFLLDLTIVREVKGSMPNVVYPHLAHTEWLDCANCHDEIFVPAKGENQISMAAILLGQKCGVCHGKVAFPVSDCRRCHAQPKTPEQLKALAEQSKRRTDGQDKPAGELAPAQ